MAKKISEANTEKVFRDFYGNIFIEKSAIPEVYGFASKNNSENKGYPDFFIEREQFCIVVEAKAQKHTQAKEEVMYYMTNNSINNKDIIGIAISGQSFNNVTITYYVKFKDDKSNAIEFPQHCLLTLDEIQKQYAKLKYGEIISTDALIDVLNNLNKKFHDGNKIRDTDRSLFFSGIMIALKNDNFRAVYKNIVAPSKQEKATVGAKVLESHNLNKCILEAIQEELSNKVNNLSKEYSWKDKFSFIKNIDYPLSTYKEIISIVENKIFYPFSYDEKQDILGRAYKIFLSRAGKVDNKNIILTPDHIKELMVKLARLTKNDVVLDTCTGSGGFLMEAMEEMISLTKGEFNKIEAIKEKQLIGFEIDPVLFALACSNMFLHGDGRTNLLFRSSLLNEDDPDDIEVLNYIHQMKPTRVIINPPYEQNSAIKFTIQAIDYLEQGGKLIIIMPTPTLTHNQGNLTEKLLERAKLDFVIKMPNTLFSEQKRTVNTSIFGFTKGEHHYSDEVLFYDLSDDGLVSIQHKGRIDKFGTWTQKANDVLDAIFNSREIRGICKKKKIYQHSNGKFILNCAGVQDADNTNLVKIGDLFSISKGTLASEGNIDGDYPFITASEEWKTHNEYTNDEEAIIYAVSASGSLGRTHYVNGKFTASNLCLILTDKHNPKYPIDMLFYNYYLTALRTQIVSDLADGTSKLTISQNSLADYYIKYFSIDEQKTFVKNTISSYLREKQAFIDAQATFLENVRSLNQE